ncbi:MAG: hypothetical protein ACJ0RI_02065 [Candidatus Neomarinimicrobiota bacterium]|tara:strand:- start:741 stop:1205 length:465 start_codon:yes stop_codon:yes gene_type:complete
MKNYITILILFSTFSLAQEVSTGNILEDHDKAVEGILSDEIKKQTQIINKSLAKQSNDVLFFQAAYSFLGIVGTIIFEANNEGNPANFIPIVLGHAIVPVLEMRDINNSNEPESLKKMRKSRVKVNSTLGSVPIAKWIILSLRMPKALLDSIFK